MVASPTSGDGFDMYNGVGINTGLQARWICSRTDGFSMVPGRFGGQGLQAGFNGNAQVAYVATSPTGAPTTVAFGIDVYVDNVATLSSPRMFDIYNISGGVQMGIGITITGAVVVYSGAFASVLGISAAGLIVSGTWHRIEGEITINASSGSVNVYLDQPKTSPATLAGATCSGVNTQGSGTGGANLFGVYTNSPITAIIVDNWLFNNAGATRCGPLRAETLRPNGNSSVAWTPSSGSNYACVNGLVVNGTTFVETATVSAADKYTLTPLSLTPSEIAAVNMVIFAQKSDAGGRSVDASAYSGGTEADGSTITLATQYQRYDPNMMTVDPNTSSAWVPANVNALLIGPKLAA